MEATGTSNIHPSLTCCQLYRTKEMYGTGTGKLVSVMGRHWKFQFVGIMSQKTKHIFLLPFCNILVPSVSDPHWL
jgi:hypothetical protein